EEELKAAQKRLEREVLQISDREAFRIGRDLHDEMSQHLLGIALKGMLLERKLKKRGLAEVSVVHEITEEINQAIAKTRKISQSLFPQAFGKKDFLAALGDLAEKIRTSFGATLHFKIGADRLNLDPEKAVHLYRIVQEAATNSIRHGRAENIDVSIRNAEGGRSLLEIRDDGSGFAQPFEPAEGLGLQIMEYRARMIGGRLEIKRSEAGGTVVRCDYPS
ncbi:MAG TPA: sensor histidine kinase, partial [bacterium]|nr:sensor histidine kinase [bacterium]